MRADRLGLSAVVLVTLLAGCSTAQPAHHSSVASTAVPAPTSSSAPTSTAAATPASTPTVTRSRTPRRPAEPRTTAPPRRPPAATTHRAAAAPLPLHLTTGDAEQVITVVAASPSSTTATLQAWRKVTSGWRHVGPAVHAYLGTDGLSRHPSESKSATPIGSFTLTRAFGRDADPGTSLPYTRTTPDDWWISQTGPLYNTRQRCAAHCSFIRGAPNEHLYYETPYYNHAVVIDYNTTNAPGGVHQGAGSAFFLHVTVGEPTQGCVSIDAAQLVRIMRWLSPSAHPRILIGTG